MTEIKIKHKTDITQLNAKMDRLKEIVLGMDNEIRSMEKDLNNSKNETKELEINDSDTMESRENVKTSGDWLHCESCIYKCKKNKTCRNT